MRDIKFRAWYDGKWFEPALVGGTQVPQVFNASGDLVNLCAHTENYSVCQYTGLQDKNGVDIYEGDICHTDYFKDNGWNAKAFNENQVVKFEDGAFQLGDFTTLYECTSNHEYALEVIANIYEHPEILK